MFKSDHLYLTSLLEEDSPILFKWINDRELVQLSAAYKPVSDKEHAVWFNTIRQKNDVFIFGIRLLDSKKLIGTCQLLNINQVHHNAELQIRIGESNYRGQGLGVEALRLLIEFGFNELNLKRIYLHVFSTNVIAQKAYAKIGFLQEGVLRQAAYINDKYEDIIVMGILNEEYSYE